MFGVTWVMEVWDSSRMKAVSEGGEQVTLFWERNSPGGHRHTAVGPWRAGSPDLATEPGPSRQMWEHLVLSHGLARVGWERGCIS